MAQTSLLQLPSAPMNVAEVAALLHGTANPLPQRYLVAAADRPDQPSFPELMLPTIDLAKLDACSLEDRKRMISALREACTSLGFFQVTNHGVPMELVRKTKAIGDGFFALPKEQKQRCDMGPSLGYEGEFSYIESKVPWMEALTVVGSPFSTVGQVAGMLWPEGNQEFCQVTSEYMDLVAKLGHKIMILLAESLQLDSEFFLRHFQNQVTSLRYNFYPTCPHPSMTLGLKAHTDPNFLTLSYQNEVGGLQLRGMDKTWYAVKPQREAFFINLGDTFQAWTNDLYRSGEHRVVVNKTKARMSFVVFCSPAMDAVIQAPEKLIGEGQKRRYRPFTWGEYVGYRQQVIGDEGGHANFKRFAGVNGGGGN